MGDGKIEGGLAIVIEGVDAGSGGKKHGDDLAAAIECGSHERSEALWPGGFDVGADFQ